MGEALSAVIEARFAGGAITVETTEADEYRPALIEVNLPGLTVALFAHEARALAAALLEAATEAETPTARLKRPHEVDDHLRELDD